MKLSLPMKSSLASLRPLATPSGRILPGPVLFARYAYPPNALGYCGPDDPAALLGMTGGS